MARKSGIKEESLEQTQYIGRSGGLKLKGNSPSRKNQGPLSRRRREVRDEEELGPCTKRGKSENGGRGDLAESHP
jgi:hypothetical protein